MLDFVKIIVLDRDGVINQDSTNFIKSPDDWRAIPGSLEAIAKLNKRGYKVVVATNQSGVARGYFSQHDLDDIHRKMSQQLAQVGGHLDGIFICPHGPNDNCTCRKPKPGLLLNIAKHFAVSPGHMLAIGDSMRDLLAAKAAGCAAILVRTGNGEATLAARRGSSDVVSLSRGRCNPKLSPSLPNDFIENPEFYPCKSTETEIADCDKSQIATVSNSELEFVLCKHGCDLCCNGVSLHDCVQQQLSSMKSTAAAATTTVVPVCENLSAAVEELLRR